jgi:hypothetical protein
MYQHLFFPAKEFFLFSDPLLSRSTQTKLKSYFSMRVQTDTASVLHETIEYIKFLHDQVGVSVASTMIFPHL